MRPEVRLIDLDGADQRRIYFYVEQDSPPGLEEKLVDGMEQKSRSQFGRVRSYKTEDKTADDLPEFPLSDF